MKFASAPIITAFLGLTVVRGWEITFYDGGNDCGQTSTNYVNYEASDSDCHVIGSADAGCAGFTGGGATSDQGLCGAPFEPTSAQINTNNLPPSGSCTIYHDSDCPVDGELTSVSGGCWTVPSGYTAFKCT